MQEVRVVRLEPFPDLDDEVVFPRLSERKLDWLEKLKKGASAGAFAGGRRPLRARRPRRAVLRPADAGGSSSSTASRARTSTSPRPTRAPTSATSPPSPASRRSAPRRRRADRSARLRPSQLREMVAGWPEFGEQIFAHAAGPARLARREGYGVMRLIAPRGSRRAFEVRDLLERNLLPVHWYDVDTDPESAEMLSWLEIPREETPVLVHADQVMRNPSPPRSPAASGLRAEVDGAALRPGRARRRAGRARGGGLRRLGGAADAGRRVLGAGRPGRDEHADRELPRLPDRGQRPRADRESDPAGAPLRRGALQLPPRRRARRRPRRAGPDRPRRRPARAGPLAGDGDRGALARAARPRASTASAAPASTTRRCRPTPSAPATKTWSLSAAATRPGRRRSASRARPAACG